MTLEQTTESLASQVWESIERPVKSYIVHQYKRLANFNEDYHTEIILAKDPTQTRGDDPKEPLFVKISYSPEDKKRDLRNALVANIAPLAKIDPDAFIEILKSWQNDGFNCDVGEFLKPIPKRFRWSFEQLASNLDPEHYLEFFKDKDPIEYFKDVKTFHLAELTDRIQEYGSDRFVALLESCMESDKTSIPLFEHVVDSHPEKFKQALITGINSSNRSIRYNFAKLLSHLPKIDLGLYLDLFENHVLDKNMGVQIAVSASIEGLAKVDPAKFEKKYKQLVLSRKFHGSGYEMEQTTKLVNSIKELAGTDNKRFLRLLDKTASNVPRRNYISSECLRTLIDVDSEEYFYLSLKLIRKGCLTPVVESLEKALSKNIRGASQLLDEACKKAHPDLVMQFEKMLLNSGVFGNALAQKYYTAVLGPHLLLNDRDTKRRVGGILQMPVARFRGLVDHFPEWIDNLKKDYEKHSKIMKAFPQSHKQLEDAILNYLFDMCCYNASDFTYLSREKDEIEAIVDFDIRPLLECASNIEEAWPKLDLACDLRDIWFYTGSYLSYKITERHTGGVGFVPRYSRDTLIKRSIFSLLQQQTTFKGLAEGWTEVTQLNKIACDFLKGKPDSADLSMEKYIVFRALSLYGNEHTLTEWTELFQRLTHRRNDFQSLVRYVDENIDFFDSCKSFAEVLECHDIEVSGYEVIHKLGEGDNGRAFLLRHKKMPDVKKVLKVFNTKHQYIKEKERAGKLAKIQNLGYHHLLGMTPIDVKVENFDQEAMLYEVGGTSLDSYLNLPFNLSEDETLAIHDQLMIAITAIESTGIRHGDIRLTNIYYDPLGSLRQDGFRGYAALGDYGGEPSETNRPRDNVYRYGYPDDYLGKNPDHFALGLALYEAVVGKHLLLETDHLPGTQAYWDKLSQEFKDFYDSNGAVAEKYRTAIRESLQSQELQDKILNLLSNPKEVPFTESQP